MRVCGQISGMLGEGQMVHAANGVKTDGVFAGFLSFLSVAYNTGIPKYVFTIATVY